MEEAQGAAAVVQAKAAVKQSERRIESAEADLKTPSDVGLSKRRASSVVRATREYRRKGSSPEHGPVAPASYGDGRSRTRNWTGSGAAVADVHAGRGGRQDGRGHRRPRRSPRSTRARPDLAEAEANVQVDRPTSPRPQWVRVHTASPTLRRREHQAATLRGALRPVAAEGEAKPLLTVARYDRWGVTPSPSGVRVQRGDPARSQSLGGGGLPSLCSRASLEVETSRTSRATMHTEIALPTRGPDPPGGCNPDRQDLPRDCPQRVTVPDLRGG